jgi:hypothetical protein
MFLRVNSSCTWRILSQNRDRSRENSDIRRMLQTGDGGLEQGAAVEVVGDMEHILKDILIDWILNVGKHEELR